MANIDAKNIKFDTIIKAASEAFATLPERISSDVDLLLSGFSNVTVLPKMSAREQKALNEVIDFLAPNKLGGKNRKFDYGDLSQVVEALKKDPQIASQINTAIWNTAYSTAESHVPNGLFSRIIRRIAYHKAEKNVYDNYSTYYAQGEKIAEQRIVGEIQGSLDAMGVDKKNNQPDNISRNISLAEMERFKVNLKILDNYYEKAIESTKVIRSVSVPENGLSAQMLENLKEGKLPNNDSSRKIPFVPSKSNLLYATDAQLVEFGIPQNQVSAYREKSEFYYDRQTDSLIHRGKEPQIKPDGTAEFTWGQKNRNGSYDQYGYYHVPSWQHVHDLQKVEGEKLDRYTNWRGNSNLTLEKIASLGKVFGQEPESFEGKYSLEGKRVYRLKDAQYVAIGEKTGKTDAKGKEIYAWHRANPSEMLDLKKYDQYNEWQAVYKNKLEKADCKTIADLGIDSKFLKKYDYYLKKDAQGNNAELIFHSKKDFTQGAISIKDLAKQKYRSLNSEEASNLAKIRSEEATTELKLSRIDPTDDQYKSMLAGYDTKKIKFFAGLQGEIIAQYMADGKLITAVNYGNKAVFNNAQALDRKSWVLGQDFVAEIEKLNKQEKAAIAKS